MTAIESLWGNFELPIRDALHYANGHSYDVALDSAAPTGFTVIAPLNPDEMLEDGDLPGFLRSMGLPP
ncbi:hypothetical protein ACFYRL_05605 [Streptomyces goshikiensis]|uniref:hypothetical protein n=1 Tax=Streptomyces goshikiensis TaxID=1942 RepID=UPI0036A12AFA